MTPEERIILEQLDRQVYSPRALADIQLVVRRVSKKLATSSAVMAWEPIPLEVFGDGLPAGIQSAWVFILRAGVSTGAERHPNSHQRMMSFAGTGDLQTREENVTAWTSNVLKSGRVTPLEQRWISIPPNVWHQPVIPAGQDWVVVSFHTVPAEELIEERPDSATASGTRQTHYISQPARMAGA